MAAKTRVPGTGCYGHTHYDGCGCNPYRLCCGCSPPVWQLTPKETPDDPDGATVRSLAQDGIGHSGVVSTVEPADVGHHNIVDARRVRESVTPDAALLAEADKAVSYALSPQHSGHVLCFIVRDLAAALRASLDREREAEAEGRMNMAQELGWDSPDAMRAGFAAFDTRYAEKHNMWAAAITRAEQAERERDALAAVMKELRADRDCGDELLARIQGIIDGTGSTGSYSHHLDKLVAAELQRLTEGKP